MHIIQHPSAVRKELGPSMDFRTLEYFRVVAEEQNFTHAAERLNMSQPPLSNQIRNLEEDLGVQLFIRGKRRLKLTEAGRLLLQRTMQILELADKTRADLKTLSGTLSGSICIGLVEGRAPYLASKWISGFREEFPMITFRLYNGSGDDVLDHLYRGLCDLAIIARPYDRETLEGIPVGREAWAAIIPACHPLAKEPGDTIPLSALKDEQLIVPSRQSRIAAIRRWFEGIGAEANIAAETANYIDAVALAESNAGISIYPETTEHLSPNVVSKVITDPMKIAEYVLVRVAGHTPTALAGEFINYVRDSIEAEKGLPGRKHMQYFSGDAEIL